MHNSILNKKGFAALRLFWKDDLKAGFNVSLIALPLCLGIALASGFPPMAGLIAAIVGGLFVSRINGSFVTITGPAAGLIVVNLGAIEVLGQGDNAAGYQYTLAAIVIAGVLISVFGFLKAGKLGDFFPTSAVHGMLAAIGVIIFVKQLFVAVAVKAHGHEFGEIMAEIPAAIRHANPEVALISLVSFAILIFYPKIKSRFVQMIPAPIWVLAVAIPLELLMDFEHNHEVIFFHEHFKVGPQLLVHLPENLIEGFAFPDFGKITYGAFWMSVATIALVTSIESLLSALAVDSLDPKQRKANLNRDLVGMGSGSSLSALVGGLPMISEIVRSSANVSSGAKTQWSNFFHGGFLLLFLLVGGPIIDHIPLAALASMLMFTGYKLASPREFKHVLETGKSEFIVFVVTLIMVLVTDLLIGIGIGIIVNMVLNMMKGTKLNNLFKVHLTEEVTEGKVVLHPSESLVFSNYLGFKKKLLSYTDVKEIELDFTLVTIIDHSVAHHLHNIEREFKAKGILLKIVNDEHLNPVSEHPDAERRADIAVIDIKQTKRDFALGRFATKHGWSYNPGSHHPRRWFGFETFKGVKLVKEHDTISLEIEGVPCIVTDVVLRYGARFSAELTELTCMYIPIKTAAFRLEKEQVFDKMKKIAGVDDINFDTHPRFSDYYLLNGEDEAGIRAFFNEALLVYLEHHSGYHVESDGKGIMVYKLDKQLAPEGIEEMIDFVHGFIQNSNQVAFEKKTLDPVVA